MSERIPVWRKDQKLMRLSDLDRDPRVDPQPGDVILLGPQWQIERYQVIALNDGVVAHSIGTGIYRHTCRLSQWREWAKGAEIIHRADGTGKESYKSDGERMAKGLAARDAAIKVAEEAEHAYRCPQSGACGCSECQVKACDCWKARFTAALAALAAAKEGK